jgi:hypothetical protein
MFEFIDELPLTDRQRHELYFHIDCVIGVLTGGEDEDIRYYEAINKRSAMSKVRGMLKKRIASRERREAMRPLVLEVEKKYYHLIGRKRANAVRKALLKREDFTDLLPKDLKDPRFIKADIESILFPPPESFEEQMDDDETTNSEPMSDLLRDLGVDPDEL